MFVIRKSELSLCALLLFERRSRGLYQCKRVQNFIAEPQGTALQQAKYPGCQIEGVSEAGASLVNFN